MVRGYVLDVLFRPLYLSAILLFPLLTGGEVKKIQKVTLGLDISFSEEKTGTPKVQAGWAFATKNSKRKPLIFRGFSVFNSWLSSFRFW
ncbi:MAG: hypothetical protein IPL49_17390 [Saprospirales bacterium]|nr:hypothetical protein [Saprospirales bacterium]